jgi:hypothetical protein
MHLVHLVHMGQRREGGEMDLVHDEPSQEVQKDRKAILHDPHHLGVPSGVSKIISEAMLRLVQTVDLSCTETNNISKSTETRFYMSHIT